MAQEKWEEVPAEKAERKSWSPAKLLCLRWQPHSGTGEGTFQGPTNTKFVGTLNSSMKVYVDQFANDTTPVLVGYKGEGTEVDAAAYYCPYIPLMS